MVRVLDGRGATKVGNSIGDAHTFSKCHDTDFGFEEVDIEFEQYIA